MPFEFEKQAISDVILIKPKIFGDNRGFFMETYKKSDFVKNGINIDRTFEIINGRKISESAPRPSGADQL